VTGFDEYFSDGLKPPTRLFNNRKLFTDRIGIGLFYLCIMKTCQPARSMVYKLRKRDKQTARRMITAVFSRSRFFVFQVARIDRIVRFVNITFLLL